MKSPRNAGAVLMLATALTVAVAATPRASGDLMSAHLLPASAAQPATSDADTGPTLQARRGCKFGQRYSSYHRRCVLWMPFDYT